MKNKLMMLGLAAILLLAMAPAYAIPPVQTTITTAAIGIDIIAPIYDFIKSNQTFYFNYHLFNLTDGMPVYSGVSCMFHLYSTDGKHSYTKEPVFINNNNYDVGVTIAAGNFSKGFYDVIMQCNGSAAFGGAIKQSFEVTNTGIEPATDIMIIFAYLISLITIALFIYMIVYSLEKFGKLAFDMKDLTYNILAYIFLLVTYSFNNQYFGIANAVPILLIFLAVGVFSMIAGPIYMFMICYFKNLLDVRMGLGKNGK